MILPYYAADKVHAFALPQQYVDGSAANSNFLVIAQHSVLYVLCNQLFCSVCYHD